MSFGVQKYTGLFATIMPDGVRKDKNSPGLLLGP
jgi:hypothetical protein